MGGVLAGGASRRFGSDKARALLDGRPLAAWAVSALREVTDAVVLLGGGDGLSDHLGIPVLPDPEPGQGPLGGLKGGLRLARAEDRSGLLVLACDLPLVPPQLLDALLAARTSAVDAVVPETDGPPGVQPLCAWYGGRADRAIADALREGRRSALRLLDALQVRYLSQREVARFADPDLAFCNINTPRDLERAELRLRTDDRAR